MTFVVFETCVMWSLLAMDPNDLIDVIIEVGNVHNPREPREALLNVLTFGEVISLGDQRRWHWKTSYIASSDSVFSPCAPSLKRGPWRWLTDGKFIHDMTITNVTGNFCKGLIWIRGTRDGGRTNCCALYDEKERLGDFSTRSFSPSEDSNNTITNPNRLMTSGYKEFHDAI